jgi:hypothetical protein
VKKPPRLPQYGKIARQNLVEARPQFYAAREGDMRDGRKIGRPANYERWLTCLQLNANAQNAESTPAVRTAAKPGDTAPRKSSGIYRRHTKN